MGRYPLVPAEISYESADKPERRRSVVHTGICVPPVRPVRRRPRQRFALRHDWRFARARMVVELAEKGISDPLVLKAMMRVHRHRFVAEALQGKAYEDITLPIGMGQTISRPYVVAAMCQLLNAAPGMRVLEIGTGSGYQAAVLTAMGLEVFTIERLEPLFRRTSALLDRLQCPAHLFLGDGTMGLRGAAPFDRVIVTAGGPAVPAPLLAQMKDGGILVIPVGDEHEGQHMTRITVRGGKIASAEDRGPVAFVDLVGRNGW